MKQVTSDISPDVLPFICQTPSGVTCDLCFDKHEKHLIVATLADVMESTHGGATWKVVASYPAAVPPQGDIKYREARLSHGKVADVMGTLFGIDLTRGASA
jgi:hypothetical protein